MWFSMQTELRKWMNSRSLWATLFNSLTVAIISKCDLADAVELDEAAARRSIQSVRTGMEVFKLSSKAREDMIAFLDFLEINCRNLNATSAV
jgi:Ni2+-binding GTPase involved in maturation of urease and hydrogenase